MIDTLGESDYKVLDTKVLGNPLKESGIIGKTVEFRCMPAVAVIGDKDRNTATLHTNRWRGRRGPRMIPKPESLPLC